MFLHLLHSVLQYCRTRTSTILDDLDDDAEEDVHESKCVVQEKEKEKEVAGSMQEKREEEGEEEDDELPLLNLLTMIELEEEANAAARAAAALEVYYDQLIFGASLQQQFQEVDAHYPDAPVLPTWLPPQIVHEAEELVEQPVQAWEPEPEQPPAEPIGTCISCSTAVHTHTICYMCQTLFMCCDGCYAKPEVHRDLTKHYRECKAVRLTPQQKLTQVYTINPDLYQWQYRQPCRNCATCSNDAEDHTCAHCRSHYCTAACRTADRERHEADGECVKSVKHQLPPNTAAESCRSSILIPDLLAHAISFLSVYQWSRAARVNHAWRNATLQPSAFPDTWQYFPIDAPNIGPAHRACFRSKEWVREETQTQLPVTSDEEEKKSSVLPPSDPLQAHLRQYSHIRKFRYYSSPPKDVIEILELLPSNLTDLMMIQLAQPSVSSCLVRFTQLQNLHIDLTRGSELLYSFGKTVLQQLTLLRELSLDVRNPKNQPEADSLFEEIREERRERMEGEKKDCIALSSIISTISLHLPSLTKLSILSYQHGLSQIFASAQLPQVKELNLTETFCPDTPDQDIIALTQLSQCFPSVTKLSFAAFFIKALLFDPVHVVKKQLTLNSLISCIDSFGPQLKSLTLTLNIQWREADQDDFHDQQFKLDLAQMERVLAHCSGLETLVLRNMNEYYRSEEDVALLARLTPRIKSLGINLNDSATASTMIESLMLNFKQLNTLHLQSTIVDQSVLSPPSPSFLAQSESLPRLRNVVLAGFDLEKQVPSLIRLLPCIDKLQFQDGSLAPWRLFEYAQYRPLLFGQSNNTYDGANIPQLQSIDESQLSWLDEADQLGTSIVVQPILSSSFLENLHGHYQRGRELASHDNHTSSSSSSSSSLTSFLPLKPTAVIESHRWMFSRVREWEWNWIGVAIPPPPSAIAASPPLFTTLPPLVTSSDTVVSGSDEEEEKKMDSAEQKEEVEVDPVTSVVDAVVQAQEPSTTLGSQEEHAAAGPVPIPSTFAFYRSSAWTRAHPDDISKNAESFAIHQRIDRRLAENYSHSRYDVD